jgi:hypothetical protein
MSPKREVFIRQFAESYHFCVKTTYRTDALVFSYSVNKCYNFHDFNTYSPQLDASKFNIILSALK